MRYLITMVAIVEAETDSHATSAMYQRCDYLPGAVFGATIVHQSESVQPMQISAPNEGPQPAWLQPR